MTRPTLSAALALLVVGCATTPAPPTATAAEAPSTPLHREIAARDAAMGDAFNRHDLPALMALFDRDVEFFHDTGGLQRFDDVQRGFAGLFAQGNGIRRELVPGSLRVYPVKGYGAMEVGRHRFCHVENGRDDCGTFEFLQVWRRTADGWAITRVMSYGH